MRRPYWTRWVWLVDNSAIFEFVDYRLNPKQLCCLCLSTFWTYHPWNQWYCSNECKVVAAREPQW